MENILRTLQGTWNEFFIVEYETKIEGLMKNKIKVIALATVSFKKRLKILLNKKMKIENYELYCIGAEYSVFETLQFEPDYILSSDYKLFKVKKGH